MIQFLFLQNIRKLVVKLAGILRSDYILFCVREICNCCIIIYIHIYIQIHIGNSSVSSIVSIIAGISSGSIIAGISSGRISSRL